MRGLLTTISATLMDCASNSFWNESSVDTQNRPLMDG